MKSTRWVLIAAVMLCTTLFAQGLRPQGRDQQQQLWLKFEKELGLQTRYTVDMEIQAMGMTMPSKMYRTEGKMRSDMTLPVMAMRMVALELTENGKTVHYSLFPDKKKYCLLPEDDEAAEAGKKPDFKLEDVGTEVYEGVTCKKRRMTVKLGDEGDQVMDMLFSPAQKNMPVKMTASATFKTEPGQPPMTITSVVLFKNYLFGAPDAALFKIPKDYTQAKDMQEIMMGGLFGGGAAGQPAGGQPDLNALLRQAQEEAAKEAKTEAQQDAAEKAAPPAQDLQQNIQNLRRLFGK